MNIVIVGSVCAVGALGYLLLHNKRLKNKVQNLNSRIQLKEYELEKIEKENKNVFRMPDNSVRYAFTRHDTSNTPDKLLKQLIDSTEQSLDIAIYSFTDYSVMEHIIHATNRGVKVRLIGDKRQTNKTKEQKDIFNRLSFANVEIKQNSYGGYMHLKLMISDSRRALVGSYNYSVNAKKNSKEIVVLLENEQLVSEWTDHFNYMWNKKKELEYFNEAIINKKSS